MSSRFSQRFIGDRDRPPSSDPPSDFEPNEAEALDAYSNVVVRVAERLRPAVVNLRAGRGRRQGSGSGSDRSARGIVDHNVSDAAVVDTSY